MQPELSVAVLRVDHIIGGDASGSFDELIPAAFGDQPEGADARELILLMDLRLVPDHASQVPLLSAQQVLERMSAPTGRSSPFPAGALPTETFDYPRKYMYLNGEGIEVLHQPAAHTDGDAIVFFRRSDIVVAGDILDLTHFPVIDVARGGSVRLRQTLLAGEVSELIAPPCTTSCVARPMRFRNTSAGWAFWRSRHDASGRSRRWSAS